MCPGHLPSAVAALRQSWLGHNSAYYDPAQNYLATQRSYSLDYMCHLAYAMIFAPFASYACYLCAEYVELPIAPGPRLLLVSSLLRSADVSAWFVQIEAYSLSQPTLEQVFLNVIGDQLSTDTASI